MAKIKLSEYCKKNGISYSTGYRWVKKGTFPGKAIQTDSGTILIETEENILDQYSKCVGNVNNPFTANKMNDHQIAVYLLLDSIGAYHTVEQFATFILTNFDLEIKDPKVKASQMLRAHLYDTNENFKQCKGAFNRTPGTDIIEDEFEEGEEQEEVDEEHNLSREEKNNLLREKRAKSLDLFKDDLERISKEKAAPLNTIHMESLK